MAVLFLFCFSVYRYGARLGTDVEADAARRTRIGIECRVLIPENVDGGADGDTFFRARYHAHPTSFALIRFDSDMVHRF